MIYYSNGYLEIGYIWQLEGSLLPRGFMFGIFSGALSSGLALLVKPYSDSFLVETSENVNYSVLYSCLTAALFLSLAFRVRLSYNRYWEGISLVKMLRAEWFDACSSVVAFAKLSKADFKEDVYHFQHLMIRLMSLLHGSALHQINDQHNEEYTVLGICDLDDFSLEFLIRAKQQNFNRVELCMHWIQELVTQNSAEGVLKKCPPPLLTRVYQELSRGMVHLQNARKLTEIPFPFPHAQILTVGLLLHLFFTPFVMASMFEHWFWAGVSTCLTVSGLWSLNYSALELEMPFGEDSNDLPLAVLQDEMNDSLQMLLDPSAQNPPHLKAESIDLINRSMDEYDGNRKRFTLIEDEMETPLIMPTQSQMVSLMKTPRKTFADGNLKGSVMKGGRFSATYARRQSRTKTPGSMHHELQLGDSSFCSEREESKADFSSRGSLSDLQKYQQRQNTPRQANFPTLNGTGSTEAAVNGMPMASMVSSSIPKLGHANMKPGSARDRGGGRTGGPTTIVEETEPFHPRRQHASESSNCSMTDTIKVKQTMLEKE